ncbi:MAG TPA: MBL fold metallo-hydrolase [Leeuwenhoekiella sp.]|nr:MBL fold metallo-hydrolase [Leeuwenhoekiella sp.]
MILLLILALIALFAIAFMMQPKFGKSPNGNYLKTLEQSAHYKAGAFQNLSATPALSDGVSYGQVFRRFFFDNTPRKKPKNSLPSLKTDLHQLGAHEDVLVWFGHSSYFLQLNGKKILVDPVFSGSASPLPFSIKAFIGSDIYTPEDIPEIDYLFLTHDHWDHLDFKTITALGPKIKNVVCGLGVGAHLLYWGFDKEIIEECDWNETKLLEGDFKVHTIPARHFSGRRFKRNGTLWTSFILKTPSYNLFIGGDSGYDTHFKKAGDDFGPFDLVILENGQYDDYWKYIHMHPQEVLQAAKDLKAKKLLPVHSGKFALANHPWDEPLKHITALHKESALQLLTPKIGEKVNFKLAEQPFEHWWVGVD